LTYCVPFRLLLKHEQLQQAAPKHPLAQNKPPVTNYKTTNNKIAPAPLTGRTPAGAAGKRRPNAYSPQSAAASKPTSSPGSASGFFARLFGRDVRSLEYF